MRCSLHFLPEAGAGETQSDEEERESYASPAHALLLSRKQGKAEVWEMGVSEIHEAKHIQERLGVRRYRECSG